MSGNLKNTKTIRIADLIWEKTKLQAAREHKTISRIVEEQLTAYLEMHESGNPAYQIPNGSGTLILSRRRRSLKPRKNGRAIWLKLAGKSSPELREKPIRSVRQRASSGKPRGNKDGTGTADMSQ